METLKDWISQEAEYQIQASEIKHGFPKIRQDRGEGHGTGRSRRTYHGNRAVDGSDKRSKSCHLCSELHPIWRCSKYRAQPTEEKWKVAKKFGLCYCCLGDNHKGNTCKWNKKCNIDGCNDNRHYLLHRPKILPPKKPDTSNKEQPDNTTKEDGPGANTEGDSQPKTYRATS